LFYTSLYVQLFQIGKGTNGKSEKVQAYFTEMKDYLVDKPTHRHLVDETFPINNNDENDLGLKAVRDKIYALASSADHWGEEIPASWVALERDSAECRRKKAIIQFAEIQNINQDCLIPLEEDELRLFLRYQHAVGNIVYFDRDTLDKYIILEPQWLSDAFRCIVTTEQSCPHRSWLEFEATGVLTDDLITTLWEDKQSFSENRAHLLGLMEQLHLIVKPKEFVNTENKQDTTVKSVNSYYVPRMARKSIPAEPFVPTPLYVSNTSTLCFQFDNKFAHPAVFHRLLAACIARWPIATRRQRKKKAYVMFNQCGQFDIDEDRRHRLLLFCKEHVYFITITKLGRRDVPPDLAICVMVREFLTNNLKKITATLGHHLPYTLCISCGCDPDGEGEGRLSVTDLQTADGANLRCHNHLDDKDEHSVSSNELVGYWFEVGICQNHSDSVLNGYGKSLPNNNNYFPVDDARLIMATKT
jgi:hypothetical protein